MKVHVANRSPVPTSALVDRSFGLNRLGEFWSSADFFVVSVPSNADTVGIVNADSFAAMRASAVILNVGRGPTIDERSLYEALRDRRIAGAVIDTWYSYPSPSHPSILPSKFPFHELPSVVMTPHMSGWTTGTIDRRKQTIADNIGRRAAGRPCTNVVRPARA
jgi:phosphoglycerate dehydrogenase-like enzyme